MGTSNKRAYLIAIAGSVLVLIVVVALYLVLPLPRFVPHGVEVHDRKTGLTWQRCSVGQTWQDGNCAGKVARFTFRDAQRQANGPWRLPTRDELASLLLPEVTQFPKTDHDAFPGMDPAVPGYWSSTPFQDDRGYGVLFAAEDYVGVWWGSSTVAVRLVRSDR